MGSFHRRRRATLRKSSVALSSNLSGHQYVLDIASKVVFRFPLAQDGLPAMQPDGVLYPQGAKYLEGLAVDRVRRIFVADPDLSAINDATVLRIERELNLKAVRDDAEVEISFQRVEQQ